MAALAPIIRLAGRGRQAQEVEELRDAREELHAERAESIALAAIVRAVANEIHCAIAAGDMRRIEQRAAELVYRADRHLRQRSSQVL